MFQYLLGAQPRHLALREKIMLALAAYNVGRGHLRDAQKIALSDGNNPYAWKDIKETLPLLGNPTVAAKTEFGLARGYEPVQFVERVLSFYEFMTLAH